MAEPYVCKVCGVEDYTPRARRDRTCRYCEQREDRAQMVELVGIAFDQEQEIEQLRDAGIRLAALLDETLGSAPGTVSAKDVDDALARWDSLVNATDG